MSINTNIILPGNVRLNNVAKVIGMLFGRPVTKERLDSRTKSYVTNVKDINITSHMSVPQMARISIQQTFQNYRDFNYHFEYEGNKRLITCPSTSHNIAIARGLVDFFGGEVIYQDTKRNYSVPDYKIKKKSNKLNQPEDGKAWDILQERIYAIKPLGRDALLKYVAFAAYEY